MPTIPLSTGCVCALVFHAIPSHVCLRLTLYLSYSSFTFIRSISICIYINIFIFHPSYTIFIYRCLYTIVIRREHVYYSYTHSYATHIQNNTYACPTALSDSVIHFFFVSFCIRVAQSIPPSISVRYAIYNNNNAQCREYWCNTYTNHVRDTKDIRMQSRVFVCVCCLWSVRCDCDAGDICDGG